MNSMTSVNSVVLFLIFVDNLQPFLVLPSVPFKLWEAGTYYYKVSFIEFTLIRNMQVILLIYLKATQEYVGKTSKPYD